MARAISGDYALAISDFLASLSTVSSFFAILQAPTGGFMRVPMRSGIGLQTAFVTAYSQGGCICPATRFVRSSVATQHPQGD
jgi:hypothetical protein